MSENQNDSNKQINEKTNKLANWGCIITALTIFSLLLICILSPEKKKTSITTTKRYSSSIAHAHKGEFWTIFDDNVAVCKNPETSLNKQAFMRNLVTVLEPNTKIEIIETKGYLSPWKYVYVYNNKNIVYTKGWILAETIKDAKKQ